MMNRAMLAVVVLFGACGTADDGNTANLQSALSCTQVASQTGQVIDNTDPQIADLLKSAVLVPVGKTRVKYNGAFKISSATFEDHRQMGVTTPLAEHNLLPQVTVTCTSSCDGNSCFVSGCDASAFGCSSFACSAGCSGSCTKTSTYTE